MKQTVLVEFERVSFQNLSGEDQHFLELAKQACQHAYAPYSNFQVGCALKLDNKQLILGTNQENMAYPSGLCAERVAIFSAKSNQPQAAVEAMAITYTFKDHQPQLITPCGACRQVLMEYEINQNAPIRVLLWDGAKNGEVLIFEGVKHLLPLAFFHDKLTKA